MAETASAPPIQRVLVSNDDGIEAPGLRSLVAALAEGAPSVRIAVCAPSGERSAQSHAITLQRYMSCAPAEVPGAEESYAVDGTPADTVMLALNGPVFKEFDGFDLVVSGINRGDNCGLHVIYSGTVGAAREAACKGIPSLAFSLDNHRAQKAGDYSVASEMAVHLIKAALGLLPGTVPGAQGWRGHVLNVNFPSGSRATVKGLHLTSQGTYCGYPLYKQVTEPEGPHLLEIDAHTPDVRVFRSYAGTIMDDLTEGSDMVAVKEGWVSCTPLTLRSDLMTAQLRAASSAAQDSTLAAFSALIQAAAASAGLPVAGLTKL